MDVLYQLSYPGWTAANRRISESSPDRLAHVRRQYARFADRATSTELLGFRGPSIVVGLESNGSWGSAGVGEPDETVNLAP